MTFSGTAGVAETVFQAVGSGSASGASTATLITVNLTGNERAAAFHGRAVSAIGEWREVHGIGYMIPETGWVLHSEGGTGLGLLLPGLTSVALAIPVGSEGDWIGQLSIEFTQNYAP